MMSERLVCLNQHIQSCQDLVFFISDKYRTFIPNHLKEISSSTDENNTKDAGINATPLNSRETADNLKGDPCKYT